MPNGRSPPAPASRPALAQRARLEVIKAALLGARTLRWASNRLVRTVARTIQPGDTEPITTWCYDHATRYTEPATQNIGFMRFEQRVIADLFPPPPARVLVPGCGGGRELIALLQAGYACSGCEPAPRLAAAARAATAGRADVRVGALADLERQYGGQRFDAVIVGWGAWGYLTRPDQRSAALGELVRLCPTGPILVSWASLGAAPLVDGGARPGVPEQWTGSATRDWRDQLLVDPGTGISVTLSFEQMRQEADSAGLRVQLDGTGRRGYPHVVLRSV